ncbi:hypothetical protein EVAR_62223_1 [Eumeta japonica]|uniref:Uncharacterized protein n=1 Tax=Eumeta variegata TaxID=151549 RepID=A0A4C1ZG37_EUMVA|nr:hypothetical protein EVAR_62223_1 [Eumeta japonica]
MFWNLEDSETQLAYFTISKPFDCDRESLIGKLRHYGGIGRVLDLLKSYLFELQNSEGRDFKADEPVLLYLTPQIVSLLSGGHSIVGLYHEPHSTDAAVGRRRRRPSLTQIGED